MPDDKTDETGKKETVDINAVIEGITAKVTEKLNEGLSSMEKRLTKKEEPPPDDSADWGSDDEEFISKKDLPKIIEKVVGQAKKETNADIELRVKKQQRDNQAFKEFPELDPNGTVFNKKFHEEVQKEMESRIRSGRTADDIDLIYDSTAAVAARGNRDGWYSSQKTIQRENVRRNASGDSFDVRGSSGTSAGPTEDQVRFAKKVGLTEEKLKQHIGKTGQIR